MSTPYRALKRRRRFLHGRTRLVLHDSPALEGTKDKVSVRAQDLSCIPLTASSAISKGRFGIAWLHDGLLCAGETALTRLPSAGGGEKTRAVMDKKMVSPA